MIDIQVLVDKLNNFESAEAIRAFMGEQGIKAFRGDAHSCVIARWIERESEQLVAVAPLCMYMRTEDEDLTGGTSYDFAKPVFDFITNFDLKHYPELIADDDPCNPIM